MTRNLPTVDISILLYKSRPYLDRLIESLDNIDYPKDKIRIFFTNNESPDDSYDYVQKKCKGKSYYRFLDSNANLGFSQGHNVIFRVSNAKYVFLVNPDGYLKPDTLKIMVEKLEEDPEIGIADAKQLPHPHPKKFDPKTGETGWCSGAAMLVRKEALKKTGLFDETFFMYVEDTDLSWRMWSKGWKCIHVSEAEVTHYTDEKAVHKTAIIGSNEKYYLIRNGLFMRMIYGNPWKHFVHCLEVTKRLNPLKAAIFVVKICLMVPRRVIRKDRKLDPNRITERNLFQTTKKILIYFLKILLIVPDTIAFLLKKIGIKSFDIDPTDHQFLTFKALVQQIRYYRHILIRWRIQRRNPPNKHVRFYGWNYAQRTDD